MGNLAIRAAIFAATVAGLFACAPRPEEQMLQNACAAGDTYACGTIAQVRQAKIANAQTNYAAMYRIWNPQQVQLVPSY
jgi:hypothetical protein